MKRLSRMLGVTLLEIMLVLAIAAMVIVMSIRYYQSATQSSEANDIMSQIIAITAAADNLSQGAGTYTAASTNAIKAVVGSANLRTPWTTGSSAYAVSGGTSSYTITVNTLPAGVCTSIAAKINTGSGSHFTSSACTAAGNASSVSITYSMTPNP
ncbi:MAG: type IV pilin protein [Gammaproteobacteria bacterium]